MLIGGLGPLGGLGELNDRAHPHHLGPGSIPGANGSGATGGGGAISASLLRIHLTVFALVHVVLALAQRQRHHVPVGHHQGVALRRGATFRRLRAGTQADGRLHSSHNVRIG